MNNLLLIVSVALVAFIARNLLDTLRPFKQKLKSNDASKCKLYKGPTGAEDFVLAKNGWIISSSVDAGHLIDEGVDVCKRDTGGLWAFRFSDGGAPMRLHNMEGLPNPVAACFMTHGLFLSNATNRLYAVTHNGNYSSVQVFSVDYDSNKDSPPLLSWIRSVTTDSFLNMSPNDVVEGASPGEVYVTQFMPFPVPSSGRLHSTTLVEKVQQILLIPILCLGLKLTTVHRCIFEDDPTIPAECTEASKTRFRIANGIAISDDRNTVFVNDVLSYAIVQFHRNKDTGMLERENTIPLTHAADNIEYKFDGKREELWMGTIPEIMTVASNEEKPFEKRAIVPGGLAVVSREGDNTKWGEQEVVYHHDGTMLSQVSFGMAHDGKVVLGSAYADGILVCNAAE